MLEELGGKDLSQHLGPSGDCGLRQVLFDCCKIGRAGFFNSQKSLEIAEVTINAYDASTKLCHHPDGPKADHALTFNMDHSSGAAQ